MSFDPKILAKYPAKSGVYIMKDKTGHVLYVGKAKNLKARIRQYFLVRGDEREMVQYLIRNIAAIDTIIVPTEREALLLENNLIKKHKPKYNVLLKDDKTYVNIVLTRHEWPALKIMRGKKNPKEAKNTFGPYTNAKVARDVLDLMNRIFPLRECSDSELKNRTRPCLLHGIKRCIAPCVDKCTQTEYAEIVKAVRDLLLGKDKEILNVLKKKMDDASEKMLYEKAAHLRDMIGKIHQVLARQSVDNTAAKSCDVLGLYREADTVIIVKLIFRDYKLIGSEHYSFHQIISEDAEILESFILQHYGEKDGWPKEIFMPLTLPQKTLMEDVLYKNTKKKIHLFAPQKGEKKKLLEMAYTNAEALFKRDQDTRSLKEKMLLDLQETLHLNYFPRRIECFDSSNIQGADPVAALVVFENGEREKGSQRYFKIQKKGKPDDYASLREALFRHFTKAKEKNAFPDLLIVDGGRGHLNIALAVFEELDIASVDAIGVAKEASLHTKGLTQEKIFLPHEKDPIRINPHSPLIFLLQQIRDEAHRVAIGFHRKRREKSTIKTSLDSVPGIGPKKRKALLTHFGSAKRICEASEEDLLSLKGISKKDVQNLKSFL